MRRRLLPGLAITAAALVAAGVVAWLALSTIASDDFVFLPDPARPVAPLVKVAGEGADPSASGPGFLFVAIGIRHATLRESLFGPETRGAAIVPEDAVLAPGQSAEDRSREDRAEMSQSQQVAAIVALRELGRKVDVTTDGARIAAVVADGPAGRAGVEAGDEITSLDGARVTGWAQVQSALRSMEPGGVVTLGLRRDEKARTARITTEESDPSEGPRRAVIGVLRGDDVLGKVDLPVDVTYLTKDVGGPSAGLVFALEIYDALSGRALTHGRRIAATGELALDGTVGAIGGVEQKAVGAAEAGAEVFLVPEDNLEDARKAAPEGLEVIGVTSFDDALRELRGLPAADA